MAERFSKDSDVGDLLEGMSLIDNQADDSSEHWWNKFLEDLRFGKCEGNILDVSGVMTREGVSLAEKVGKKLKDQHETTMLINNRIKKDKATTTSAKECVLGLPQNDKAMRKAKSDLKHSGSTWTIKMLARYVTKEDVDFKPSPRSHHYDKEMKDLSSRHSKLMKEILEIDEKIHLAKFSFYSKLIRTECDIRMVLDAILLNVCTFKTDLRIQTEVTIKSDSLPTNKADYVVSYKNSPLAIVEAKRPGSLTKTSVAQLVLQLLSLSAIEPLHLYFGLLFDGHMAIFVGMSKDKVLFFQHRKDRLEYLFCGSHGDREKKLFIQDTVVTLLWHMKNAILHRSGKGSAENWAFTL